MTKRPELPTAGIKRSDAKELFEKKVRQMRPNKKGRGKTKQVETEAAKLPSSPRRFLVG